MSRIVTTISNLPTRRKGPVVEMVKTVLTKAKQEQQKPHQFFGIYTETHICDSSPQIVSAAQTSGWTQLGLFSWYSDRWTNPVSGYNIYLKGVCVRSNPALSCHARIVRGDDLSEVPGSAFTFVEGADEVMLGECAPIELHDGSHMVQADCLGSDDESDFATIQLYVIVRQRI